MTNNVILIISQLYSFTKRALFLVTADHFIPILAESPITNFDEKLTEISLK